MTNPLRMENKYIDNPIVMCNTPIVREQKGTFVDVRSGDREATIARRSRRMTSETHPRGTL
jgi:hypothetical protein